MACPARPWVPARLRASVNTGKAISAARPPRRRTTPQACTARLKRLSREPELGNAQGPGAGGHDAPTQRHGYISPDDGYVPARSHAGPLGRLQGAAPTGAGEDDRHHPLHRVYRKRIRGIRMRWFGSGLGLGVLVGILLTLIASALVVTQ